MESQIKRIIAILLAVCFLVSSASATIPGAFEQKPYSPTSAMSQSDIASAKLTLRPEAKFSYTITDGSNKDKVACFTDESMGDIVSWLWRFESYPFGFVESSTEQNPCYTYGVPSKRSHKATLTVTDRNGLISTTSEVFHKVF